MKNDELLKRYMKLKNYTIFNEKELVHGDLGPTNIIWDEKGLIKKAEETMIAAVGE